MPSPLSRREFLAASSAAALTVPTFAAESKKLVLIAGRPSHGPGAHEFNAGVQLLAKCLHGFPGLETSVNLNGWPKSSHVFDDAAGILIYADGGKGHPSVQDHRLELLGGLMKKGVGFMCAHYGVEVEKDLGGKEFMNWIGGYYETGWSCNPIWRPEFKEFPKHPISNGVKPFSVDDEWYFNMRFRPGMKGITRILTAVPPDKTRDGPYVYPKGPYKHIQEAKGRPEHMMWAVDRDDGGRGVGFTGGTFSRQLEERQFPQSRAECTGLDLQVGRPEGRRPIQREQRGNQAEPRPEGTEEVVRRKS